MMTKWIFLMSHLIEVTSSLHYSFWLKEIAFFKTTSNQLAKMLCIQARIYIHIYASKIREFLTKEVRDNNLPYSIIADEVTDPHANQEVICVCLRFVDLTFPKKPHKRNVLLIY